MLPGANQRPGIVIELLTRKPTHVSDPSPGRCPKSSPCIQSIRKGAINDCTRGYGVQTETSPCSDHESTPRLIRPVSHKLSPEFFKGHDNATYVTLLRGEYLRFATVPCAP